MRVQAHNQERLSQHRLQCAGGGGQALRKHAGHELVESRGQLRFFFLHPGQCGPGQSVDSARRIGDDRRGARRAQVQTQLADDRPQPQRM